MVVHPHILDNWFERDYNLNYVANCLVNEVPLSISKTCENRFIHMKNKNDEFMDLSKKVIVVVCLVITVLCGGIIAVTLFSEPESIDE